MSELVLIGATALLASGLTLFSGFGLGTLLMPVFALFFPVPVAIAATAVVHLANNLFKLALLARLADWRVVLRFGGPAALAAVAGASTLALIDQMPAIARWSLGGAEFAVTPVKAVIGLLIVGFALFELSPASDRLAFRDRWMPLGGVLSGYFGGLSGNQGALRSAFLIKSGLGRDGFVATSAVCAAIVDVVRLSVYGAGLLAIGFGASGVPAATVVVACLCAFAGAWGGRRLLTKVTLRGVRLTVATMMLAIGSGLIAGVL
ncbi:MAG: TSUP family transporter [Wenzhouxiangellaceae bacterium]|nr:TSUP family transporter [Wenzhouxiangellaceae bacterium]